MIIRRRRSHLPIIPFVPTVSEYDPRAAEFDDVDYRDVFASLRPDPDEPRSPFAEYGR